MNEITMGELQILAALFVYSLAMSIVLAKSIIFAQELGQVRNHIGVKLSGYALLIIGWVGTGWLSILGLRVLRMLLA
jgi:hypothetical protein